MNFFTAAYLARLELWGLLAAGLQGGLLAVSWFAWARAAAGASAGFRHRLACLHFAALALLPALTVALLHVTAADSGITPLHGSPIAALPAQMASYRAALWLALPLGVGWFAGALVMLLQLARDARRSARLQRRPAPVDWTTAVHLLAHERMRIVPPSVCVAAVTAPQVVGWRRPVLLAPADFASRLPADEREAVWLHELAHLKRGDFGWNLAQRLVLALLWFHPAAWMLYRRVSRERECCCDALAVRHGASATGLARALVRLAEQRTRHALGMPVAAQGELAVRVRGLIEPPPGDVRSRGGRVLAAAFSVCCLLACGAGRLGNTDPALADLCHASVFGPTLSIQAHDGAGSFALRIRRGRVVAASVERQPLPPERIRQQGRHVTLLGPGQLPILALVVTPQDKVEWTARR